jgi:Protein of unknown function (DUF3110)
MLERRKSAGRRLTSIISSIVFIICIYYDCSTVSPSSPMVVAFQTIITATRRRAKLVVLPPKRCTRLVWLHRCRRLFLNNSPEEEDDIPKKTTNNDDNDDGEFSFDAIQELQNRIAQQQNQYIDLFDNDEYDNNNEPEYVHVIAFSTEDNNGVGMHSIEYPYGSGMNYILLFESHSECTTFAESLRNDNTNVQLCNPIVSDPCNYRMFRDDCISNNISWKLVPKGTNLRPPTNNVDQFDILSSRKQPANNNNNIDNNKPMTRRRSASYYNNEMITNDSGDDDASDENESYDRNAIESLYQESNNENKTNVFRPEDNDETIGSSWQ